MVETKLQVTIDMMPTVGTMHSLNTEPEMQAMEEEIKTIVPAAEAITIGQMPLHQGQIRITTCHAIIHPGQLQGNLTAGVHLLEVVRSEAALHHQEVPMAAVAEVVAVPPEEEAGNSFQIRS